MTQTESGIYKKVFDAIRDAVELKLRLIPKDKHPAVIDTYCGIHSAVCGLMEKGEKC